MTEQKPKQMSFAGAIKTVLTKYADFRGTASRPEYWYFFLFSVLISMVTSTLDSVIWPVDPDAGLVDSLSAPTPLGTITQILLLLPTIAVQIRRLRDAGFSAHFQWLNLIPLALFAFALPAALNSFMALPQFPTEEQIAQLLVPFLPAIATALMIGLFFFIATLLPSKAKFQKKPVVSASINTGDAN